MTFNFEKYMDHLASLDAEENDGKFLTIDGHDDAWLGTCDTWDNGARVTRGIYDAALIVDSLVKEGMPEEEALEYIEFNIEGGYVGPHTPILLWRSDINEERNR